MLLRSFQESLGCSWDLTWIKGEKKGILGVSLSPRECPTAQSCGGVLRYRGSFAQEELYPGGTTNLWVR